MNTRELYAKMAEINRKTAESLPSWSAMGYGIPVDSQKEPPKRREKPR
jgi:hypothetical protein